MTSETSRPLSRNDIQRRASRGALWTGLHAIVSLPLNVVSTVLIARVLQISDYGQLAYFTVIFAVVQQVTDLGYTSSAVQWGSQARVNGDDEGLRQHLSKVTGFHVLIQAPLFLAASFVILRSEGIGWTLVYAVVNVCFLYISCASLALVLDQRNDLLAKIALSTNIIAQGLVITAALTTRDVIVVLVVRAATGILPGLAAIFLVRSPLRFAALRPRGPLLNPSGYWRFAFYSWGSSSIALLVFSRSEILVLQGMSTAEQTALFALAFGVSQQLTGPIDALIAPLVPAIASLLAAHTDHLTRAIHRSMNLSSLLAGFLMAGAVPALYGIFPLLYGNQYGPAAELFIVLGSMSTFQTATIMLSVLVQAQRQGRRLLTANAAALIINLAAAFSLIPTLGAWGAMVANCAGQLTSIALLAQAAGTGPSGVRLGVVARALRPWLAAVPALVIGSLVANVMRSPLSGLGAATVGGLVGTGIFVAVLRTSRSAPPMADLMALSNTLPAKLHRPAALALSVVAAR